MFQKTGTQERSRGRDAGTRRKRQREGKSPRPELLALAWFLACAKPTRLPDVGELLGGGG